MVTIGSDSPTLPVDRVEEAFTRLARLDMVIVPAADGGYVLLGTSRFLPDLFRDIPWSTPRVCDVTCRRARETCLTMHRLPGWYDVDDAGGLARLQGHLNEAAPRSCPSTRRFLERARDRDPT